MDGMAWNLFMTIFRCHNLPDFHRVGDDACIILKLWGIHSTSMKMFHDMAACHMSNAGVSPSIFSLIETLRRREERREERRAEENVKRDSVHLTHSMFWHLVIYINP